MAKSSPFRDLVAALRRHWRAELPQVRPIDTSFGPAMPKASTFYAGVTDSGLHVFVNFQHSDKGWEVGQFTVNLVLSHREGPPVRFGPAFPPEAGRPFTEGSYRIGHLLGREDKWWHLRNDLAPILGEAWRPTSYADPGAVLAEAVADVTRDVRAALARLGVDLATGPAATDVA